jgi:exodeoxyribonuclease VII small subunit
MTSTPLESMNFEDALRELEAIVRRLEEGKTSVEDAIKAYERGASLRTICEKKLKDARLRVEQIVVGTDGTLTTKPTSFEE